MMKLENTKIGARIELLSMTGTFMGTKKISHYMKNYCDGFSRVLVRDEVVGLIKWDEASEIVTIDAECFSVCDVFNG